MAEIFTRYQRQTVLPEIGEEGQNKLLLSKVLLIGVGGLGTPCAAYLAQAGIGHLEIIDADTVSFSNLNRQFFSRKMTSTGIKQKLQKRK